jgi:hypothetical protein
MELQTLYRPVGLKEYTLIVQSNFAAFPPRLEWQPIFYPVMNEAYARQIALEWNTKDAFSGYCGIVTSFALPVSFLQKYPVQVVGGDVHQELWVPAEELEVFNQQIVGGIQTVVVFTGIDFVFPADEVLQSLLKKYSTS